MRRPNRCDVANAVLNVALFALGCIVLYAIAKALPAECLAVVLLLNGLREPKTVLRVVLLDGFAAPPWWGSSGVPVCKALCVSPALKAGLYFCEPASDRSATDFLLRAIGLCHSNKRARPVFAP